ncbi:MAG: hypothetical protein GY711_28575 [bacterium]|nr:hypothetical protein [bacterium]
MQKFTRARLHSVALWAGLAAAPSCSLPSSSELPWEKQEPGLSQDLAPPSSPQDALVTIARLEDARSDGGGLLQVLLKFEDEGVRVRATQALGRLPLAGHGESVTEALGTALRDTSPRVRATAAFGIGLRADVRAKEALLEAFEDPEDSVRARVVEAASRIDDEALHRRVLAAALDPAESVRIEVAVAPHRWPSDDTTATATLQQLCRDGSDEVAWRALFSLARREESRNTLLTNMQHEHTLARLFATKGVARLADAEQDRIDLFHAALVRATRDPDPRVATEAVVGLGQLEGAHLPDEIFEHAAFQVRSAAYTALAGWTGADETLAERFRAGRADASPTVRAAALVAEARARGTGALPAIEAALAERDAAPLRRRAVVEAITELPTGDATPRLLALSHDASPAVAGAAVAGLGRHADESKEARRRLVALLAVPDNGLRLAAVLALQDRALPADLPALRRAYRDAAKGDIAAEVRFATLRTASTIEGDDARAFLRAALEDPHPYVRSVARAELAELGPRPASFVAASYAGAELPARVPVGTEHPRVAVRTSKGTMVFELFPSEAPVHVHNFLELARRGYYDGLSFTRVVPDFVIQGGCYRGDGNGAGTWRGQEDALRAELGPRKYVRGSLGMPRNEDLESAGSQFFVTHRPTPHLDGGYTIFGELREGFEVLDAIEVGDRIVAVKRL